MDTEDFESGFQDLDSGMPQSQFMNSCVYLANIYNTYSVPAISIAME